MVRALTLNQIPLFMATNKLTDAVCRRAPTPDKLKKLSDGGGMYLALLPTGGKVWRLKYLAAGKEQTEVLGPYPLLTLAEARVKRDEFKKRMLNGEGPKRKSTMTFGRACAEYWAGRKDVTERYRGNATRGLDMHLGVLKDTPVSAITRQTLLDPLLVLDAQGKHVYSRRVRVWASEVLEWCTGHGHCSENVALLINPKQVFGRARVKHHAALALGEVQGFFERMALEKDLQSVVACRFLALTWVRTGELRMMTWDEIDGDVWRIPAARMKRGKDHLVPLPRQALAMMPELKLRCRGSKYVFPSDRRIDRPMSENSILYLLGRIGYSGVMTGHGFRTVASTWAHEVGWPPEVIEMQLAHSPEDAVASAYNRAAYIVKRREMLQSFADWLEDLDPCRLQSGQAPHGGLAAQSHVRLGQLALDQPAPNSL